MSLGIVIKGAEGIVLAADSRVTLIASAPDQPPIPINFDNATKLLKFGNTEPHKYVGAVTYGQAVIGGRTAHSFMPEFQISLGDKRKKTEDYAKSLANFFMKRWEEAGIPSNVPGMTFIVGGYDEKEPYGRVYLVEVPNRLTPEARNQGDQNFGMTWGGQLNIASRLIHGWDPILMPFLKQRFKLDANQIQELSVFLKEKCEYRIPYDVLPLQDCIDLAAFLIRATIAMQNVGITVRGVGGIVEIATITRTNGLKYVQKKRIHGEFAEDMEYHVNEGGEI